MFRTSAFAATALWALCAPVQAQSSVSLYGLIDLAAGSYQTAGADRQAGIQSGGMGSFAALSHLCRDLNQFTAIVQSKRELSNFQFQHHQIRQAGAFAPMILRQFRHLPALLQQRSCLFYLALIATDTAQPKGNVAGCQTQAIGHRLSF